MNHPAQRTSKPSTRAAGRLLGSFACLLSCAAFLTGCVERTARIETAPPGAIVLVNDEEVGISPTKFSFLWYGDYDIIIRKEGYETLKTHHRIDPPWYQIPPFDIVAELMVPAMIRDEHVLPTYTLQPAAEPPVDEVVERAVELRERALYEGQ